MPPKRHSMITDTFYEATELNLKDWNLPLRDVKHLTAPPSLCRCIVTKNIHPRSCLFMRVRLDTLEWFQEVPGTGDEPDRIVTPTPRAIRIAPRPP